MNLRKAASDLEKKGDVTLGRVRLPGPEGYEVWWGVEELIGPAYIKEELGPAFRGFMHFSTSEDTFPDVWSYIFREKKTGGAEYAVDYVSQRAPGLVDRIIKRHRKTGYYLPPRFKYAIGPRQYRI